MFPSFELVVECADLFFSEGGWYIYVMEAIQ